MEFKGECKWVCGDEDFSMQITLAARYNFYIARAVKSLIHAAQKPCDALRCLEMARADIDREIERRAAEASEDDLHGLAKYEAQ